MTSGLLPERVVPKRKQDPPQKPIQVDPPFGRIELQAPADWIEELDRAAAAVGLSRSAYIRLACNRLMAEDRRSRG